jgi:hypothetical protein
MNPDQTEYVVGLVETTFGYQKEFAISCSDNFAFTGQIYPGTYKVTVFQGTNSLLSYLIDPALPLTSTKTDLTLDIKAVAVAGKVTLNGAPPVDGPGCAAQPDSVKATVFFTEKTLGHQLQLDIPCSATDYAFAGMIPTGTYEVSLGVQDFIPANLTSLPVNHSRYVIVPAVPIMSAMTNVPLDVKTFTLSGKVTLNGAIPPDPSSCTTTKATVSFIDKNQGGSFDVSIPCTSTDYSFSQVVVPGTYRVQVKGTGNLLPQAVIMDGLTVSASMNNLVVDEKTYPVAGTIRVNGAVPMDGPNCVGHPDLRKASVLLNEPTLGYTQEFIIPCSSTSYAFQGVSLRGIYQVRVQGIPLYSNLQYPSLPVVQWLSVP